MVGTGRGKRRDRTMRTLTAYGIGVIIVFAILNGVAWQTGTPRLHNINVFSAGFILGMLGTCLAGFLYGYRQAG
jgi:hydrogenase/urease accessory protein HupE